MAFHNLIPFTGELISGLITSIYITLLGIIVGTLLGLIMSVVKGSKNFFLRKTGTIYVEVFRNTPLLIQIYFLYFGLGQLGVQISTFVVVFIGLSLINGAYMTEIFRAGFLVVDKGIEEAGSALGLSKSQVFRYVALPPALKSIYPAMINQFVLLFLFSSIASVIAFEDLTYAIMNIQTQTSLTFEIFIVGALIYYITSTLFILLSKYGEKKLFRW